MSSQHETEPDPAGSSGSAERPSAARSTAQPFSDQSWWGGLRAAWSRFVARLPMGLALSAVAAVWVVGAVWSFNEQTDFATFKQFSDPHLLPLVLDGLAVAMAGVAFAASLDARPAVGARLGTALAVTASAGSNGLWAAERSTGPGGPDLTTVVIGAGVPIAANIAFEVLLGELRRQVQRRRGLPAPVALPPLRMVRLVLAPPSTIKEWRAEVLARTDPTAVGTPAVTTEHVDELSASDEPRAQLDPAPDRPDEVPAPQHEITESGQGGVASPEATEVVTPATATAAGPGRGDHVDATPTEPEPETDPTGIPTFAADADAAEARDEGADVPEVGDDAEHGDPRVRLLAGLLVEQPDMTGKDAETALEDADMGTSYRTARRLLAEARRTATPVPDHSDDDRSADDEPSRAGTDALWRPAPLSLVPGPSSTPPAAGELP